MNIPVIVREYILERTRFVKAYRAFQNGTSNETLGGPIAFSSMARTYAESLKSTLPLTAEEWSALSELSALIAEMKRERGRKK